jgi:hypothetical protein
MKKRRGEYNYLPRHNYRAGPIKASGLQIPLPPAQRMDWQPLFCWAPPKAQRSWNRIPQYGGGPLASDDCCYCGPAPVVLLAPASHNLISA